MPRRRFIDKKNATTFALVHRAQNDPLIHDENAPSMVFAEKAPTQRPRDEDAVSCSSSASIESGASVRSRNVKQRGDLEEEFGIAFRPNEGEAAQHGVFFDDTQYDYMQHMKDLGSGEGPVTWVEAKPAQDAEKAGKGKQRLEDALRDMDIVSESGLRFANAQSMGQSSMASSGARSLLPEELLPSEFVRRQTYQDQQDVPDAIGGFQPGMDPRLREALEALDDEAYVDDEEGIFGELTAEGREIDRDEWERLGEQQMFEEGEGELDDDGWESDDTIKASSPPPRLASLQLLEGEAAVPPIDTQAPPPIDPTEGAWIDEFKKFNSDVKATKALDQPTPGPKAPSVLESSALSSLASGRRKKRRGAKTSTTNYSMTSSALARTDQQTLLDARFDKIEEDYAAEEMAEDEDGRFDDAISATSGLTGMSKASRVSKYSAASDLSRVSGISSYNRATDSEAPRLERSDFNSIMDEFLGGYSTSGQAARRVRRGGPQTGMQQLDEIRNGLGPARVSSRPRAS